MPNASLSVLGMSSVTAHQGIFDILDVKPEHVVLISGAAGAVGNMAVQLAKKVVGAKKVIGIAGGKAKCDWVKSLGADECVDYKDANFAENLKAAVGKDYIDRVFENVGGEVFNTVRESCTTPFTTDLTACSSPHGPLQQGRHLRLDLRLQRRLDGL